MTTQDPTYEGKEIEANPVWKLAHWMSEMRNDNAPVGWGKYIPLARDLLDRFELTERK